MKKKINISSFIEIFTKYILILILLTGVLFVPTIYLVNAKTKLQWNISFNLDQNEKILYPFMSSVIEKTNKEKEIWSKDPNAKPDLLNNKTVFEELVNVSKFSSYVVAQNLRSKNIEFTVNQNSSNKDFVSFILIKAVFPAEIGSETDIRKYMRKLEEESSNLLSFLLKLEYGIDLIKPSDDNLLNFRIKSIVFLDNKNLLLLKSFIVCLSISYTLIFLFVNRRKIRFI